ncbi:DUF4118 domain-containing protein [Paraburkholderia fungorum]|uniref:DUF4118 domain-containing protein n=1 Tax=Paraburkholderia fungorum TaxID=134537 RepID=UPI00248ED49E|nr:DUF4118 domain-containing protein [Paraburkholderia fungorum]
MIRNAKRWAPRGAWRYAAALLAAMAAFGARELMHPMLEAHMPALFFTVAAVITGFSLGFGPACLVVLVGVPLADFYFVPPYGDFGYVDKADLILFVSFPTVTFLFLGMIEWLRRTQHEARLREEVARSRHDMLLRGEIRRRQAEASRSLSARLLTQFEDESVDVLYCGKVGSRYEYVSKKLEQRIGLQAGSSAMDKLIETISSDDAKALSSVLGAPDDRRVRTSTMSLPSDNKCASALVCHVERFPTDHGSYVIVKTSSKIAA